MISQSAGPVTISDELDPPEGIRCARGEMRDDDDDDAQRRRKEKKKIAVLTTDHAVRKYRKTKMNAIVRRDEQRPDTGTKTRHCSQETVVVFLWGVTPSYIQRWHAYVTPLYTTTVPKTN